MFTRIEVMDQDTGRTTFNYALDCENHLALFLHANKPVAEDTKTTIGTVLAYAAHVWDSLVWTQTDSGPRATIKFGRFIIWLYR